MTRATVRQAVRQMRGTEKGSPISKAPVKELETALQQGAFEMIIKSLCLRGFGPSKNYSCGTVHSMRPTRMLRSLHTCDAIQM
jgi:hypothetical protein